MQQQRRRSGLIIRLVALGLLAGAALTASPAQAASGVGPYLAEPAWDRKITPASRFLVLTNWNREAVLDKETGLVWEKAPGAGDVIWSAANCNNKTVGGRAGWRLPSIPELMSLVDFSAVSDIKIPGGHPFTISPGHERFWSREPDLNDPTHAFAVIFGGNAPAEGAGTQPKNSGSTGVWCVRGGINANSR